MSTLPRFATPIILSILTLAQPRCHSEVNKAEKIAPDVYFHEGDIQGHGHCNNGWVVFEDYVLVIDANFPSGAREIIPKIRAITDKPIRFAFDTHHHGDHSYGNQVWVQQGAVPVAHTGVIDEMKKYETGYYGDRPGRWEDTAKSRKDMEGLKLKPPTLLFRKDMIFDDGKHRVELLHFGTAHTHGDGFAWLPKEKILFTGDACVNGAYNYTADGDIGQWIQTLEGAKQLGAQTICPGHGPMGPASVLNDQQAFFMTLRREVQKLHDAGKTAAEAKAAVPEIKALLTKDDHIARYVGGGLQAQVEKTWIELGGQKFMSKADAERLEREHAHEHGTELARNAAAGERGARLPARR